MNFRIVLLSISCLCLFAFKTNLHMVGVEKYPTTDTTKVENMKVICSSTKFHTNIFLTQNSYS